MTSALQKQHKEIVRLTVERDAWRKAFDALWVAFKAQCELIVEMNATESVRPAEGRES